MNRSGTALTVLLCALACWLFAVTSTTSLAGDDPWCNSCWCCPLSCPEHATANDPSEAANSEESTDDALVATNATAAQDAETTGDSTSETPCETEAAYERYCESGFGYEYDTSNDNTESWTVDGSNPTEAMTEELASSDEVTEPQTDDAAADVPSEEYYHHTEYQYDRAEYWTSHMATEPEVTEDAAPENDSANTEYEPWMFDEEMDALNGTAPTDASPSDATETGVTEEPAEEESSESEAVEDDSWMYEEESDTESEAMTEDESETESFEDTADVEMTEESAEEESAESGTVDDDSWTYEEESESEAMTEDESETESFEDTAEAEMTEEPAEEESSESEAVEDDSWMYEEESDTESEAMTEDGSEMESFEDTVEAEVTEEPAEEESSESEAVEDDSWSYEEESDAESEAMTEDDSEMESFEDTAEAEMTDESAEEESSESATYEYTYSPNADEMDTETESVEQDLREIDEATATGAGALESGRVSDEGPIDPVIPDPQAEASVFQHLRDGWLQRAGQAVSDLRARVVDLAGQLHYTSLSGVGEEYDAVPTDETQR
jgi:hypothetical protein